MNLAHLIICKLIFSAFLVMKSWGWTDFKWNVILTTCMKKVLFFLNLRFILVCRTDLILLIKEDDGRVVKTQDILFWLKKWNYVLPFMMECEWNCSYDSCFYRDRDASCLDIRQDCHCSCLAVVMAWAFLNAFWWY